MTYEERLRLINGQGSNQNDSYTKRLQSISGGVKTLPVVDTVKRAPASFGGFKKFDRQSNVNYEAAKPKEQTFWQKAGSTLKSVINDPLVSLQKTDDYLYRNLGAGAANVNKNVAGAVKSIGGDKVPGVKNVLNWVDDVSDKAIAQGDTSIPARVVQTAPQMASNAALAFLSGGASVPAQLGGNATVQAAKSMFSSPTFVNTMLNVYGGAYNKARSEGADRLQAITKALLQAFPESLIEQMGGVEQLPQTVAKEGLLKTIAESALGEGLEEILQYPLDALSSKATYAPDTPWFSMKDEAVINPIQMGEAGLIGGLAGGIMGGGAKAISGLGNIRKPSFDTPIKPEIKPSTPENVKADIRINPTLDKAFLEQRKAQQEAASASEPRQESPVLQQRRKAEQLRREYEEIKAASKLTPDELTIAEQIRKGNLSGVPSGYNTQIINDVAEAGKVYDEAQGQVKSFNENRKQNLRDTMNSLLEGSDNAKDKAGLFLSREIQERNAIDVFGERAGKQINETVFRPVHDNEAKKTRFINKNIERVKTLNLSKAESEAVQMLGEGKITENDLPAGMDKAKVKSAVTEFRKIYDGLLALANDVLVNNGYAPVEYRKDYFPHFEDPQDPFAKAMKQLGFKVDNITLPTDIAGITHQFRPGKKWFGNFLRREGANTTYDALEGFERYLYGISDVIYHTYDIQRLRAFETAIRSKYAPDNIKNRITEIEASGLSADEQQAAIDELFDISKGHLGNYVTNLREYTDNLAGKKSISDRNMEHKIGRAAYNIFDNMNTQVARNMVGWNVSSWLTNFIPLAQAGSGISSKNFAKAAYDTAINYYKDDGFVNKSTFLTNRKGTERLTRSTIQKIADAGMQPMQVIDDFTSQVLVRGKYLDEIQRGAPPVEAMRKADSYVAGAMGDRSKGSMPTVFNTKNPVTKLFSMFQLEVNNQFSFLFKDMPREAKKLGGKWLASTLLKFMVGSYLYNEIYQFFTGRRPAIDPIGTVKKAIKSETPLESIGKDVLEQTPFVGGILGGGRLPVQAALPKLDDMKKPFNDLVEGNGSILGNLGKLAVGAAKNPIKYLLSPVGGGGQLDKTIKGIGAYSKGASLTDSGRMRYPIPKTPLNALRTGLFGQYSTPEARQYFDKNQATMGLNQTKQIMNSQAPQAQFERFLQQRQINNLSNQIKDISKDTTLTRTEKDKKIAKLREKIFNLRAAQ